ncbi:MAG: efflux RND transporter periplasmic adaptor subunit [Chromatiaceae bacterium]|nr:efflux RND transporter periplasmic adaptor subunit [Chromatiaceae bacterium]
MTARLITVLMTAMLLVLSTGVIAQSEQEQHSGQIPELDCVIEPSEVVDIGSAVPGLVEVIAAERNDLIVKGAIVARLESSVEQATLELSKVRASLNTAIELRQEGARFGQLTQARNKSLLQTAAISRQEMDAVESETRIAELQVRQEQENKRIAGLELVQAQAVLDRRTIRTPVNGVVLERFKSAGEYVDDEPVMRVAQLDPLHVEVIVSTDFLGFVEAGMQAKVVPVIPNAATYQATVERVDRISDAASGTFGARLTIPNPDYRIPAGLRCRLSFMPTQQADAPLLGSTVEMEAVGVAQATKAQEQISHSALTESIPPGPPVLPTKRSEDAVTVHQVSSVPVPTAAESGLESATEPHIEPLTEQSGPAQKYVAEASDNGRFSGNPVQDSVTSPGSCHVIGPFQKKRQAAQWRNELSSAATDLTLRDEQVPVITDFLVRAVFDPTTESAAQVLVRLDKAGITDRHLFRRGANKGQISLGVYRNRYSAEKRQSNLTALGFATEISPRHQESSQYWLDVTLPPGSGLPESIAQLPANTTVQAVACMELLVRH